MTQKLETYKITQNGDTFIAKIGEKIMFEGNCKNLQQAGDALFSENESGKFDLYLPVRTILYGAVTIDRREKCLLIKKDICSYQFFNNLLLLRMEECILLIHTVDFSILLSESGLLPKRLENVPLIEYTSEAHIVTEQKPGNTKEYSIIVDDIEYSVERLSFPPASHTKQLLALPVAPLQQ